MLETLKYLMGIAGPSGHGSKSNAEQVTESNPIIPSITAIVTGTIHNPRRRYPSFRLTTISGATSGIGAETARVLAKRGATVVIPARNRKAAADVISRIRSELPESRIIVMDLDLSSLRSVRQFAAEFESLRLPLNVLINNAGKFAHEHALSDDGVELTFATNYLGHFLLTQLLLKTMITTAKESGIQGRIVNVSSRIHSWFTGDIVQYIGEISANNCSFDPTRAYALSKLANALHTKELAEKLKAMEANVTVNAVNPGIVRTKLTREREGFATDAAFFLASKLLKTIPQAAATSCYVATHPNLANVSGKYFEDCNEASPSKLGCSAVESARLWAISEILVSNGPKKAIDPFLSEKALNVY